MLPQLLLVVAVATAPDASLEVRSRAVVDLLEHALQAPGDDAHLEDVVVTPAGRQVRGVILDLDHDDAFMDALTVDASTGSGRLAPPRLTTMTTADHEGVEVVRLWAFQEIGGEDPALDATRAALWSLANRDVSLADVRRYGRSFVVEGSVEGRDDLGRWIELLGYSPCVRDPVLQEIDEEAVEGITLFWLQVEPVEPFASLQECAPDPARDDLPALEATLADAREAGFDVTAAATRMSTTVEMHRVELTGEQAALRAWLGEAELPPVHTAALGQDRDGSSLRLRLALRRPGDAKAWRKILRWHEARADDPPSGALAGAETRSLGRRVHRDVLHSVQQLDRDIATLHELEGTAYTSALPDGVAELDVMAIEEFRLPLMTQGLELVKRDDPDTTWRNTETIARKLDLEQVEIHPLAPLQLSGYLVGYPVHVEAAGDVEQLQQFLDRLATLPRRSDRSQLRILPDGDRSRLTGAVVYVLGAPSGQHSPGLDAFAGIGDEPTAGDPFAPSSGLRARLDALEALPLPERYAPTSYVYCGAVAGEDATLEDVYQGRSFTVAVGAPVGGDGHVVEAIEADRVVIATDVEDPIMGGTFRSEVVLTRRP